MDPWEPRPREEGPPPPRRPGWGCLVAAIVTAVGFIVIVVLAVGLLGDVLSGITIR